MAKKKSSTKVQAARVAGKVVEWQKKAVDQTLKVLERIQARAEKAIQDLAERSKWLPKEGKEVVVEWIKTAKKSRADIRRAVDVSFVQAVEFCKRVQGAVPARTPIKKKKAMSRAKVMEKKPALAS